MAPQFPQPCQLPADIVIQKEKRTRRMDEKAFAEEGARAAQRDEEMDACIRDVLAVNDLELATAGAF